MIFSCHDTPFYYKIEGKLRQALNLSITNQTGATRSGTVTVSPPGYDIVVTGIPAIKEGTHSYTVYAPVVYPNFGTIPEYQSGRHRPVSANVKLEVESEVESKSVMIGTYRPWTIYVCQDVCSDFTFGYSESETKKLSVDLIDAHLRAIDATDLKPADSQNRWNINQTMEVMWYLERKSAVEARRLFRREGDGHLQISPIFSSCLTATMSTEQAIRSLYFGRKLEREYGVDISTVEHIEMPTIAWGMASIFAGAGVKYFVKGWLDYQAPYCSRRDDVPLYYWEGPDGSLLLTASDIGASQRAYYAQASFLRANYEDAVRELHEWWIPHFEHRTDYPYNAFILLGSHGDLGRLSISQVDHLVSNIIRYNEEHWEYPKIVNANWIQFFKHIEDFLKKYGVSPQTLRGDCGSSWEEWPAAIASVFAGVRRGVERFIIAEKLAALSSRIRPEDYRENRFRLEEAMLLMELLAEHAWVGNPPRYLSHENMWEDVEAFHRKHRWQIELNEKADAIITIGLDTLASEVPTGPQTTILVFNALPWRRTSIAQLKVTDAGPFTVTDEETGQKVPSEVTRIDGNKVLHFEARDIPTIGYKTYILAHGINETRTVIAEGNVIENQFYRVEVDPSTGGLQSVFDKQRNVELVDATSPCKLNQYLYLSEEKEYTPLTAKVSPGPVGAVSGSLVIEASTLRSQVKTTLTLYSNIDRIDIANEVTKTPSSEPTQIYFVFPFNVPDRVYHYEATGAIIKPGLTQYSGEQLKGSGQSSHSCRSFVDVSNDKYGVTLSMADSYLIQFGHPTTFESPTQPDSFNSTILSLVMVNKNYREFIRNQGGISDFVFRYAIQGHTEGFKGDSAVRFGWEWNNELLVKTLPLDQTGSLPPMSHSFLSCSPENVVVTALKVAEEGPEKGLIVRAWETNGKMTTVSFDISALGALSAAKTDLLERDQEGLPLSEGRVSVSVPARGFVTVRLRDSSRAVI